MFNREPLIKKRPHIDKEDGTSVHLDENILFKRDL